MAIDFPASPVTNDTFTSGSLVYTYDGTKWTAQPAGVTGGTKIEVSNTKAEITDTGSNGTFAVTTEGTQRLTVDSSGKCLVGTTTARNYNGLGIAQFQLEGTGYVGATFAITNNENAVDGPYIYLNKSRGTTNGSKTIVQSGDKLGSIWFRGTDGSNEVWGAAIDAAVDGTPGTSDMPCRLIFSTTADGASTPTERMRISNNGLVLIGRTAAATSPAYLGVQATSSNPALCLDADSTAARTHIRFNNPNGNVGYILTDGSSTTYSTSSDYRLKENVVNIADSVDRLMALSPRRFNFITDPDKTVDGFIAHEAQVIVPECVTGTKDEVDADGNPVYQGIDQSKLVPLLTAALQEAIGRIETLEAKVAALEAS